MKGKKVFNATYGSYLIIKMKGFLGIHLFITKTENKKKIVFEYDVQNFFVSSHSLINLVLIITHFIIRTFEINHLAILNILLISIYQPTNVIS